MVNGTYTFTYMDNLNIVMGTNLVYMVHKPLGVCTSRLRKGMVNVGCVSVATDGDTRFCLRLHAMDLGSCWLSVAVSTPVLGGLLVPAQVGPSKSTLLVAVLAPVPAGVACSHQL